MDELKNIRIKILGGFLGGDEDFGVKSSFHKFHFIMYIIASWRLARDKVLFVI